MYLMRIIVPYTAYIDRRRNHSMHHLSGDSISRTCFAVGPLDLYTVHRENYGVLQ